MKIDQICYMMKLTLQYIRIHVRRIYDTLKMLIQSELKFDKRFLFLVQLKN